MPLAWGWQAAAWQRAGAAWGWAGLAALPAALLCPCLQQAAGWLRAARLGRSWSAQQLRAPQRRPAAPPLLPAPWARCACCATAAAQRPPPPPTRCLALRPEQLLPEQPWAVQAWPALWPPSRTAAVAALLLLLLLLQQWAPQLSRGAQGQGGGPALSQHPPQRPALRPTRCALLPNRAPPRFSAAASSSASASPPAPAQGNAARAACKAQSAGAASMAYLGVVRPPCPSEACDCAAHVQRAQHSMHGGLEAIGPTAASGSAAPRFLLNAWPAPMFAARQRPQASKPLGGIDIDTPWQTPHPDPPPRSPPPP